MTVIVKNGNLLNSDCNVIIHQANCFNNMSAGIALQIKVKYPDVFLADRTFPKPLGLSRLGNYSRAITRDGKLIYNMYSQLNYGKDSSTDYQAMHHALKFIIIDCTHSGLKNIKIGLPYGIGCGFANDNWDKIYEVINRLSIEKNQDIYLYKI